MSRIRKKKVDKTREFNILYRAKTGNNKHSSRWRSQPYTYKEAIKEIKNKISVHGSSHLFHLIYHDEWRSEKEQEHIFNMKENKKYD